jgi:cell division protein FtsL
LNPSIKPQPRTRKKTVKEKGGYSLWLIIVFLLAFLVPGTLVYVWLNVQTVSLSYDIAKAQRQKQELLEINKKLRIQLANLKSPERIEGVALTKLGLRPPEKGQIELLK